MQKQNSQAKDYLKHTLINKTAALSEKTSGSLHIGIDKALGEIIECEDIEVIKDWLGYIEYVEEYVDYILKLDALLIERGMSLEEVESIVQLERIKYNRSMREKIDAMGSLSDDESEDSVEGDEKYEQNELLRALFGDSIDEEEIMMDEEEDEEDDEYDEYDEYMEEYDEDEYMEEYDEDDEEDEEDEENDYERALNGEYDEEEYMEEEEDEEDITNSLYFDDDEEDEGDFYKLVRGGGGEYEYDDEDDGGYSILDIENEASEEEEAGESLMEYLRKGGGAEEDDEDFLDVSEGFMDNYFGEEDDEETLLLEHKVSGDTGARKPRNTKVVFEDEDTQKMLESLQRITTRVENAGIKAAHKIKRGAENYGKKKGNK